MLQKLLFQYRNTPHASTETSSDEALFAKKLRTQFDLLKPSNSNGHTMRYTPPFQFATGKRVSCRNYSGNTKWLFGNIVEQTGSLHYKIRLDDGRVWRRHVNQMRPIGNETPKIRDEDFESYSSSPPSDSDNSTTTHSDTSRYTRNSTRSVTSDGTIVNASPSTSKDSTSCSLVSTGNSTPPSSPGPSYSMLTTPETDAFVFSTPQGSFFTSTSAGSPTPTTPEARDKLKTQDTTPPIKPALNPRPMRPKYLPTRLRHDYVLKLITLLLEEEEDCISK